MQLKKYLSLILLTLLSSAIFTSFAHSHAGFNGTYPIDGDRLIEAPKYIEISLSEEVTIGKNPITLIDSTGSNVDLLEAVVEAKPEGSRVRSMVSAPLQDGWYAVQWQVISKDSHLKSGSFTFIVGNEILAGGNTKPKDPTAPFKLIANPLAFASYISTLLALGLLLAAWPLKHVKAAMDKSLRWSAYAATLGLVTAPLNVLNFALLLNGGSLDGIGSVFMVALQSTSGTAQLIRISALFAICTSILLATEKSYKIISVITGALGAVALTYSYAITGHTSVVPLEIIAAPALIIHLLAASAWLGGVPGIYWAFKNRSKATREDMVEVISKFSKIATISVIAVAIAGFVVSISMFKSINEIQGRYGYTLIAKILLVSIVAAIGAYNHYKAVPDMRMSLQESEDVSERSMLKLSKTLKIESVFVIIIALATTALTSSGAPAAGGNHGVSGAHGHRGIDTELTNKLQDETPQVLQSTLGDGGIEVQIKPARVSEKVEIVVKMLDALGKERASNGVTIYISLPEKNIGPLKREAEKVSSGIYSLTTNDIGLPGRWVLRVEEKISSLNTQTAEIDIEILPKRESSL